MAVDMDNSSETFVTSSVADGIATITLNRPEALNALIPEMTDRMADLVVRFLRSEKVD